MIRRDGHKCKRDLCENRVPHADMYCCAACQQDDKSAQRTGWTLTNAAPPKRYVAAQVLMQRKNGTDRRTQS